MVVRCSLLATMLVICAAAVALWPSGASAVTTQCGDALPEGAAATAPARSATSSRAEPLDSGNWRR